MKKERMIVCSNCDSELGKAKDTDIQGKLSQKYCPFCNYTMIPYILE